MLFADAAAAEHLGLFDHRPRQFAKRQASNPRERSSNGMKVRLAEWVCGHRLRQRPSTAPGRFHPLYIGLPQDRGLRVRE